MIKLFGIGNILLCDDAIGVRVLEKLTPSLLSLSPHIEAIVGETDYYFCLDCITETDFVIIIDAMYLSIEPGSIRYFSFSECSRFITASKSAHEVTFLKILKDEYPKMDGYLIGIEISKVNFSTELSPLLQSKLDMISSEILKFLEGVVKAYA